MNTEADINNQASTPQTLTRIIRDPAVMEGRACIRGMRVTVGMVVGQTGAGRTIENVLEDFPYLEREDVLESLQYAAWLSQEREIVLASG
ncbi:hypothetical protein AB833_18050 [Chromatiales bacterium (ex Bugula neritina AB1)]|nr:hypothetical protein AB833_18050 [Chromatiales bacterium (ex Bugula neritina AB1)]